MSIMDLSLHAVSSVIIFLIIRLVRAARDEYPVPTLVDTVSNRPTS